MRRGPLSKVILAATGEDIHRCARCSACDTLLAPGMDLSFGELLQAADRDDPNSLTSQTLWSCDDMLGGPFKCQQGINLEVVILALRHEAELRGLGAPRGAVCEEDG
ncbi:MAG: hypothetical protein AB1449_06715 [Chloroflexota bacterium]